MGIYAAITEAGRGRGSYEGTSSLLFMNFAMSDRLQYCNKATLQEEKEENTKSKGPFLGSEEFTYFEFKLSKFAGRAFEYVVNW